MSKLLYQDTPIDFISLEENMKYRPTQKIRTTCVECGKVYTNYRANFKLPCMCSKCRLKKTTENYDWSKAVEKTKKTKLQRYGDAHYTNPQKIQETLNSKTVEEKQQIKDKIKQTNLERYGGHPAQRDSQKEQTKQTCLLKYGTNSPFQNEDVRLKYQQSCMDKYGVKNPFQLETIKERLKQKSIEKYGCSNPRQSKLVDDKIKTTCLEKYGCEHPWSNYDVRQKCMQRYEYKGIKFDSSWELYYYIFLTENNIDCVYQPNIFFEYDGHKYYPDFLSNGEYYEIKGNQFFENGKMINPYDRSQDVIYEAKHQCMLQNNVHILTEENLSNAFEYVDNKYTQDFVKLFKHDLPFPYPNLNLSDKSDYGIIRHFHQSIYEANRKKFLSPKDAWNDKNLILKSALNRLRYVKSCTPNDILYGFSVAKIAPKVSVFAPSLAQNLIAKYLIDAKTIFDPFSGFSGRMLGSYRNGKEYIGQDINEKHIEESNKIKQFINYENCILRTKDILNDEPQTFDALFTCPPYEDKEAWNTSDVNLKCDDWIDLCLNKYNCKTYLFVIDETTKYIDNIVEEINNTSHINQNKEYVILIQK